MDFVKTLIFSMIMLNLSIWVCATEAPLGICQCAVFDVEADPLKKDMLILKNTEIDMPVNDEGRKECSELCVAIAEAARGNASAVLCDVVKDVNNLLVTVYSHLTPEPWEKTNKTSKVPLCCKTNRPVPCIESSSPQVD